jgi:lysophospholipase L1-like esterase
VRNVDAFEEEFRGLVRDIRERHPSVPLVLAQGPMLTNRHSRGFAPRRHVEATLRAIQKEWANSDDLNMTYVQFNPARPSEGFGADYHPSRMTQARMADELWDALSFFRKARLGP